MTIDGDGCMPARWNCHTVGGSWEIGHVLSKAQHQILYIGDYNARYEIAGLAKVRLCIGWRAMNEGRGSSYSSS